MFIYILAEIHSLTSQGRWIAETSGLNSTDLSLKLQSELVSAEQCTTRQSVVEKNGDKKTGSYCKLVHNGDHSVDTATMALLLKQDDISSIKEEKRTVQEAFLCSQPALARV